MEAKCSPGFFLLGLSSQVAGQMGNLKATHHLAAGLIPVSLDHMRLRESCTQAVEGVDEGVPEPPQSLP